MNESRFRLGFALLCLMTIIVSAERCPMAHLPDHAPVQHVPQLAFDRPIRLHIEYDDAFLEQHGDRVEDVIREAIVINNIEWRRYRREWFVLGDLTFRPSGTERDGSYLLAKFLHRTPERAGTVHVNIVGRQLEVYPNGSTATAIGGLAYRGSDVVLISAAPGVPPALLAYYLFHELGHCWDALDIPFHGGQSTFGSKTRMTFAVDAGNEEIMEDSGGPLPRQTPGRAPMVIRKKLARARFFARDMAFYTQLHDLLLREPSPSNPDYIARKRDLLAVSGPEQENVLRLLQRYEITPRHLRADAAIREQIAKHYWRANDAIANRDFDTADAELRAVRTLAAATPEVHMLIGAVEKKIRKRR